MEITSRTRIVANSFSGWTGRLGKPEIHINRMEKDVAAKAPQR